MTILSDEIYQDLVYPGIKHIPLATLAEDGDAVISAVSPSKAFNLSGMQLSAMISRNEKCFAAMIGAAKQLRIDLSAEANPLSLVAFEAAFREGQAWIDALMPYVSKTRDDVVAYFAAHVPQITVIPPESTYLLWLDCRKMGLNDEQLRKFFIMQAKIGLSPGITFGETRFGLYAHEYRRAAQTG